jgi:hypothetical protein
MVNGKRVMERSLGKAGEKGQSGEHLGNHAFPAHGHFDVHFRSRIR